MTTTSALHAQMDRLVGTWRTEGTLLADGERWSGYDVYEWFPGERHLVHRVDVEIFGGRKEAIEIFTPRDATTFDETSFDADGTVEHGVGSFDELGRYRHDGEHARAVLTFDGADAMQAHWQLRQPDSTWVDWMDVTFSRIAKPHIEIRSKSDHSS